MPGTQGPPAMSHAKSFPRRRESSGVRVMLGSRLRGNDGRVGSSLIGTYEATQPSRLHPQPRGGELG